MRRSCANRQTMRTFMKQHRKRLLMCSYRLLSLFQKWNVIFITNRFYNQSVHLDYHLMTIAKKPREPCSARLPRFFFKMSRFVQSQSNHSMFGTMFQIPCDRAIKLYISFQELLHFPCNSSFFARSQNVYKFLFEATGGTPLFFE